MGSHTSSLTFGNARTPSSMDVAAVIEHLTAGRFDGRPDRLPLAQSVDLRHSAGLARATVTSTSA